MKFNFSEPKVIKMIKRKFAFMKKYGNFISEFNEFSDLDSRSGRTEFKLNWSDRYPVLNEKSSTTSFDAHYIYHPAWAARVLARTRPSLHIDISSTLHFCTVLSAFIPVDFYDLRPAKLILSELKSLKTDLLHLPFEDDSVKSLSCMHVIEHIRLGRYGDPLDANGDLKAFDELIRVLAKGGNLLIVVPVGKPRICFNAHRIYDPTWIEDYFEAKGLHMDEFAIVTDQGILLCEQSTEHYKNQDYACGCYVFSKGKSCKDQLQNC